MNPAINGQYMALKIYERARTPSLASPRPVSRLGVQGHLLAGRGERPGDLHSSLLAKDEPKLAGWTQAVRMRGTEGRARPAVNCAEKILMKKAVFAGRFRDCGAPVSHVLDPDL